MSSRRVNLGPRALGMTLAALTVSVFHGDAQPPAWTLATLHSFQGAPDGASPGTPLIPGKNGIFYGTTTSGGVGSGTVFELRPPGAAGDAWTETAIWNFEYGGSFPIGLVVAKDGSLYGTTAEGGAGDSGTIFGLTPPGKPGAPWAWTLLYTFTGGNDGSYPGGLIMGQNGRLYGTTLRGGTLDLGTVFKLDPPVSQGASWTETVIYNFTDGAEGANPGGLTRGPNGVLYGATSAAVFELSPPASPGGAWAIGVLHDFLGGDDGLSVVGVPVVGQNGVLYGVTRSGGAAPHSQCGGGCGTVFALQPPASPGAEWEENVLYRFRRLEGDGFSPNAGVIIGARGALFGTTTDTAFRLTPPASGGGEWSEDVLVTFEGPNGSSIQAGLTAVAGALYGTASQGGATQVGDFGGYGTAFALTPD